LVETTAVSHSEQRAGQIPKVAILVGWLKHVVFFVLIYLVVLTILKNTKVNGKDYPIYYGKIKMSQTTNQCKINMEYHGFTMMDVNYV
jgi:hypothetical protein